MSDNRQSLLLTLTPLIDGVLIALAGWLAYRLRWDDWTVPADYLLTLLLGTALSVALLPPTGSYRSVPGSNWLDTIGRILPGLCLVAVILSLIGTFTKTTAEFSRLWMSYWFALSFLLLMSFRLLASYLHRRWQKNAAYRRQILIVGDGEFACSVAKRILASVDSSLSVCGFVAMGNQHPPGKLPAPILGCVQDLESILSAPGCTIDEVWIAAHDVTSGHREFVLHIMQHTCLTIRFVPDLSMLALLNHAPTQMAGMTVINLNASPLTGYNRFLKSSFDKTFAAFALLLLAPLLAVIAILIKFDSPGPVLFWQQRHGWDGRIIRVFKFRTMTQASSLQDVGQQAVRNDPRVTSLGRLLRRNSLDELPQFFNVLLGTMSVVGPRPHPIALNDSFTGKIDAYMQRHRVKPGITGWAQVNGLRGGTDTLEKMQKRVELDLYYIEHWSLWLDIRIILLTLVRGWRDKNAY